MSLYDAREHVRTIGGCPSRHDPEPTGTPVSPPPHLELSRHSVQMCALSGTICTEWLNLVGLGGEVAVDVGDEVGFAVDLEAHFAVGADGGDDGVGCDLA